jgi:pimeloyl-ACP methyl ester carboxylesterase
MHGMNRFRRARPESVLSRPELASIRTPTTFILGRDDPYLTVSGARRSVDQIRGGRLLEMPGGHAPWLADPDGAAKLITGHSRGGLHYPSPVAKAQ